MLLPLYIASCSSVASIQDAADATVLDLPNLLEPLGGLLAVLQYPCSTPAVPLQYPYSTPAVPLQYPYIYPYIYPYSIYSTLWYPAVPLRYPTVAPAVPARAAW